MIKLAYIQGRQVSPAKLAILMTGLVGIMFYGLLVGQTSTAESRLVGPSTSAMGSVDRVAVRDADQERDSVLAAHREWKETFQPVGDGWQVGTAHFDRRGVTIGVDGEKSWGLELAGYGIGRQQRLVAGKAREVSAAPKRLGYCWDDLLEEWYVSDARGIEHGYTISRRPAAETSGDQLTLTLDVRGTASARVSDDRRSVLFADGGAPLIDYNGLRVWDAKGRELPAHFEMASPRQLQIVVDDQGASYPVTVDPWMQDAYLKASNPNLNDYFGQSVAIDGDTAVVGAPGEESNGTSQTDNSQSQAGAAYVYVKSGGVWTQQAYLKASNVEGGDVFGIAVGISGDTIVVGASYEASGNAANQNDNSASGAGAAYVFVRSGGVWTQQAYLKASNIDSSDEFGFAVAISGDTIVVGAHIESSNGSGPNNNSAFAAGAAYVFVRSGGVWTQQAFLKSDDPDAGDEFGFSVGISGDTIIVGSFFDDGPSNPGSEIGAAFIFVRTGGSWSQQTILRASNGEDNDLFGSSVAVDGDTAVVGATGEASNGVGGPTDNSLSTSGAAYVFKRTGGTWAEEAYLKASNVDGGDEFGSAVSVSGDQVLVSAKAEESNGAGGQSDNSASAAGAAYIFKRTSGNWAQTDYLKASNAESNDNFGYAVAISGLTAVVGARAEASDGSSQANNAAPNTGAVYAFSTPAPVTPPSPSGTTVSSVITTTGNLGSGGTATVTVTVTNGSGSQVTPTVVSTLPEEMAVVSGSCVGTGGSCVVSTMSAKNGSHHNLSRVQAQLSPQRTVTWTGAVPANGSVTYSFRVQVGTQVQPGTSLCIATTVGGAAAGTVCTLVSAPPVGPGLLPLAASPANQHKAGSILIFNLYTSGINPSLNDTRITITNTNPVNPVNLHLFFVDGSNCSVADQFVTLTQNQTMSQLASDVDPGVTGYLIVVATDSLGCPIVANDLLGGAFVKFESGHRANLPALGIAGLGNGSISCDPGALSATIAFDGVSFNELPRTLAIDSLESRAAGTSTLLVVNRLGGSLLTGASTLGTMAGLLFDDKEVSQSFTLTGGSCQLRGILGNNFPRTAPRYDTVIPAGRTGWLKFWTVENMAISGVMVNDSPTGFSQGHNLHTLTTTTASLTIPIFPAN